MHTYIDTRLTLPETGILDKTLFLESVESVPTEPAANQNARILNCQLTCQFSTIFGIFCQ